MEGAVRKESSRISRWLHYLPPPEPFERGLTNVEHRIEHRRDRETVSSRRISTETKASTKTTELIAYVVVTLGVIIAAIFNDESGPEDAAMLVTILTVGYMISRGLAKSGSREGYDDN